MNQKSLRGSLLLLLGAVIWGAAFAAQRMGMDHVPPFTFSGVRMLLGGLVLIPASALSRKKNSAGQVSAYQRTSAGPRKQAGAGFALPLTASVVMAAAAVLVMVFAGKGSMLTCLLIALLLTAGSLGLAFYAGRKSGNAPARPTAGEQYFEVSLDHNKLYHSLLAVLTVVDRNLGEVENAARLNMADSAEIRREADTPQLNLLADLLEQAYTQKEEEWAEEIISEIRFYLHRKGIDTLDYSPDRSKWFDMMPAQSDGTLRPALVEDGVLLKKGLAAAVYRS